MATSETLEFWILHELMSFSIPKHHNEFLHDVIEKATRVLGVSRLAIFTKEGDTSKPLVLFGFQDDKEVLKEINKNKKCGYIYNFTYFSGFIYMEQTFPISAREVRLFTIFARRVEEFLNYKRLEAERRELERKTTLLNSIPDPAVIITPDNVVCDANNAWLKAIEVSPSEIIGKPLHSIQRFDEKSREKLKKMKRKWLSSTDRLIVSVYIKGKYKFFEVNPASVEGSRDIALEFRDITKLKEVEEKFKKSVELLNSLINAMPDSIYFKDPNGRYSFVNKACTKFLGKNENEIIGKTDKEILPPDLAEQCKKSDELAIAKRDIIKVEEKTEWKGRKVILETIKAPIYDIYGNFRGILSITRDITERKQVEKLKRFRTFMEYSSDAIFIIRGESGRVIDVNKTACKWTGYSKNELLKLSFSDIIELPVKLNEVVNKKDGLTIEGQFYRKDGAKFPVSVSLKAVEVGEEKYVVAIVRNISELKEAEERIKTMNKQLSLLNKILRHDIKNNLTVMKGYLELFRETPEEEFLDKIDERIDICSEFVSMVKDIESALTTGEKVKEVNLSDILSKEVERLRGDDVIIISTIPEEIYVKADEMLSSVFGNILFNAIFHNDKDVKEIDVKVNEKDRKWVEVRIADNGPGIPEDMKEEIFKEGVKGSKTGRTGLGLFIAKMLVEKYGGKIWVEDNEPEGSVFVIRLKKGVSPRGKKI